jgi:hypothetical protein
MRWVLGLPQNLLRQHVHCHARTIAAVASWLLARVSACCVFALFCGSGWACGGACNYWCAGCSSAGVCANRSSGLCIRRAVWLVISLRVPWLCFGRGVCVCVCVCVCIYVCVCARACVLHAHRCGAATWTRFRLRSLLRPVSERRAGGVCMTVAHHPPRCARCAAPGAAGMSHALLEQGDHVHKWEAAARAPRQHSCSDASLHANAGGRYTPLMTAAALEDTSALRACTLGCCCSLLLWCGPR